MTTEIRRQIELMENSMAKHGTIDYSPNIKRYKRLAEFLEAQGYGDQPDLKIMEQGIYNDGYYKIALSNKKWLYVNDLSGSCFTMESDLARRLDIMEDGGVIDLGWRLAVVENGYSTWYVRYYDKETGEDRSSHQRYGLKKYKSSKGEYVVIQGKRYYPLSS